MTSAHKSSFDSKSGSSFSEAAQYADFSEIRYAQCWEDADILLPGLDIQPGESCLSIASAGENVLSMLTHDPARVVALDMNPAQLACLELRVAAFRNLEYEGLLELIGSRKSERRRSLYAQARPDLSPDVRHFWDSRLNDIEQGIGRLGKFERYFSLFRRLVLPLIHSRRKVKALFQDRERVDREVFYNKNWNTWRWRMLFRVFFSRFMMGRLGRDPSFFRYVEGRVADRILDRIRHAIIELNPHDNPYLQWICLNEHATALPHALRQENFELIRSRLDRLEWHTLSLEHYLDQTEEPFDCFNLSDIFEYMSEENYHYLLRRLVLSGRPGGRLAYWNMLAPRSRPESMAHVLRPLTERSQRLHAQDKACFYSAFIVEELIAP